MSDTPDVSVVMSVYNDAAYLREAVESILRQEGVSRELIVINDGSTDGSGDLLDEYARKDPSVRVLHQDNQGLTRSLIVGCSMARGRYIARQDSDDISLPGRLRRLANELDQNERLTIVSSLSALMGPGGEFLLIEPDKSAPVDPRNDTYCHGSLMFRRDAYELIGGYRAEFRAAQDVDLQFRLTEAGGIGLVPELLYAHRILDQSISSRSPIQKRLSRLAEAAREVRYSGNDESQLLAEASRISSEVGGKRSEPGTGSYFIGRCLYARRDRRALPYLWAACANSPFSIRSWIALALAVVLTRSNQGQNVTQISGLTTIHAGKNGGKPVRDTLCG